MNNRGVIGIILFFAVLFLIVIVGIIGAVTVGVLKFGSNTVTPTLTDIGMVGDFNASHAAEVTFGTANTIANALPWLMGFAYLIMIVMSVVFAISYRFNPNPVYIGFYVMLTLMLIIGCFLLSNLYEDLYAGTSEIATALQNQALLSFMIIYSPLIMAAVAMITGIYLFAVKQETTTGGGFV